MNGSVRPSVRPSITRFWLCSHHCIIMKFSGVITSDRSDVHAIGQSQRLKVKVTEVNTQLSHFQTVTQLQFEFTYDDEMMHIYIEEVPYCFLGSSIKFQGHTGWKIDNFNPIWVRLLGRSQLSNPSDLPSFLKNKDPGHSFRNTLLTRRHQRNLEVVSNLGNNWITHALHNKRRTTSSCIIHNLS